MDKSQFEQTIQRLMEGLPASLQAVRADLEAHFQRVLQSGARRLDLVSREEFDAQSKVLERSLSYLDVPGSPDLPLPPPAIAEKLWGYNERLYTDRSASVAE